MEIPLHKYLQDALSPDKFGDAKHYIDNELRIQKYGASLLHARKSSTLCVVASNNIDPEIWKFVIDTEKEEGIFKHSILERDTLLLLIKVLGLEKLLKSNMN